MSDTDETEKSAYFEQRFAELEERIKSGKLVSRKPWYRNASVLIAGAALLVSLVSAVTGLHRSYMDHRLNLDAELRSIVSELGSIETEEQRVIAEHRENSPLMRSLVRTFDNRRIDLTTRALEIIEEIPELIGSTEQIAVAAALMTVNRGQMAIPLVESVISIVEARRDVTSGEVDDAIAANRMLGAIFLESGKVDLGRSYYRDALESTLPITDPEITHANTYIYWAIEEARFGDCEIWDENLSRAEQIAGDILSDDLERERSLGCDRE